MRADAERGHEAADGWAALAEGLQIQRGCRFSGVTLAAAHAFETLYIGIREPPGARRSDHSANVLASWQDLGRLLGPHGAGDRHSLRAARFQPNWQHNPRVRPVVAFLAVDRHKLVVTDLAQNAPDSLTLFLGDAGHACPVLYPENRISTIMATMWPTALTDFAAVTIALGRADDGVVQQCIFGEPDKPLLLGGDRTTALTEAQNT
jgi:hypothetical protein